VYMYPHIDHGLRSPSYFMPSGGRAVTDRSNIVFTGEALPPVKRTTTTATAKDAAAAAAVAAAAGGGGGGGAAVAVPVSACDDMVGICSSPSAGSAPPATATTISAAHFICAPAATAPLAAAGAAAPSPPPPIPPRSVSMSPALHLLLICSAARYCYCDPTVRYIYSSLLCCWCWLTQMIFNIGLAVSVHMFLGMATGTFYPRARG
jgi:hypothetical protein